MDDGASINSRYFHRRAVDVGPPSCLVDFGQQAPAAYVVFEVGR